jgi:hypothetical protein
MDLILVNNTGLVVSLGGGGLITPENLTLTTSSASLPPEADIKMELIREVTTTEFILRIFFLNACQIGFSCLQAGALSASIFFYTNIFTLIKAIKHIAVAAK